MLLKIWLVVSEKHCIWYFESNRVVNPMHKWNLRVKNLAINERQFGIVQSLFKCVTSYWLVLLTDRLKARIRP